MTTNQLYEELNKVNHSKEKRLLYANLILANPDLLPKILDILFMVDDKMSPRAGWVLEFMCSENVEPLLPYLDIFTANIHKVHLDSAVRPVAKICELLATHYSSKEDKSVKTVLTETHKERIIETCFDYMINDEKVAAKAYGMTTLFMLGHEYDWVHPELEIILNRDFAIQSAAFKARARHILKKLKKRKT
ncbi:adenylosuccinate lyase [Tamlana sp. 2_MG-2023]|uniref:adenylosuccinate lyase n=1 Tax=unclassified Tamlana TaxID=2614803 RepID=UPI0026E26752|nr:MULTISPECIES: adenylosuccinate lyase [unclassified Tamlana]MDO6760036.1 adenylosuccinate lyase [Tamlana sp. 2_MG-2023]MDO6790266.1 adenylosuccinate lyase [Tamlana sp. 1_MG-2023]